LRESVVAKLITV